MEIIHTHTHTHTHTCIVWASLVAQLVENPPAIQETLVQFLVWKTIWKRDRLSTLLGFPGGSDGKESTCNAADLGSIPGLGRLPGGGHGNPLQDSCLQNPHGWRSPMERTERLSTAQRVCSLVAEWCLNLCIPMDARLLFPWDFPGKNPGVSCHF